MTSTRTAARPMRRRTQDVHAALTGRNGTAAIEYSLVAALIAAVLVAALAAVGANVVNLLAPIPATLG